MTGLHISFFDTEIGTCGIAWHDPEPDDAQFRVVFLQLPESTRKATIDTMQTKTGCHAIEPPPYSIAETIDKIRRHLSGDLQDLSKVPVSLEGAGPFALRVYNACRKIPPGKTVTYGRLAEMIQRPKSARAVGQALARNPVPLLIPCHRVLTASGKVGGFLAPGGTITKKTILATEGVVA